MKVILDNKSKGKVGDVLGQSIEDKSSLSVLTQFFSIYGYLSLKEELEKINSLRLLIPSNKSLSNSAEKNEFKLDGLIGNKSDRRFRNTLNLKKVAYECSKWLKDKAEIKAVLNPISQNLFHIKNTNDYMIAICGSSSFTSSGFGIVPSMNYQMNTCFSTSEETLSLLDWFESIWNDGNFTIDVKNLILDQLGKIYNDKSPELLYYFMLYNIFSDFLGEIEEDQIIKTRTGIKDTLVWNKLYSFQKDGVLGTIDKIEKYNGCIIADSVGLGKTYEALAIIKYYELRNDRILVLCPKKLRENWTIYTINDKRNIFAADRFNYDVLNHTDLTRTFGQSGEINLEMLNWSNYDMVVIDESHNFRNNPSRKDSMTRYSRLMQDIIKSGVKTKVLMLSATPVNNRMNDLKNQVAFITEGIDDALDDSGISSIEQTLRRAQTKFNQWLNLDNKNRTTETLLETLNFDYFKLLDLLTIARSRKHIEKYYDTSKIGDFAERSKPINIKEDIDTENKFPELREINRDIRRLNLSFYAPLKYVLPNKLDEYSRKYDIEVASGSIFKQIDREQSLIHLMRVNMLKRMESSINSFSLTVEKLLGKVRGLITRLESHEDTDIEELSIEDIEIESEEFDPFLVGNKIKVLIQDVDRIRWKQELKEDEKILDNLLKESREIDSIRDAKLQSLKEVILRKCQQPINPDNKKMIIFTAFADTAKYLYENISEWAKRELGINTAMVTGGTFKNETTVSGLRNDLASIISAFSPIANDRIKPENSSEEIDILISTDCLSEGQNLQDCDHVVNYDIHWNPVRIIQRFGRIDRICAQNQIIQLVNFWPNMELDEYINLEARVSGRMVLLDISATGEENIIESTDKDKMKDLEYRRKQLEQLQNEVVDIEDLEEGISITDLTLNDFRMDLGNYLKDSSNELEDMSIGSFSVVRQDDLSEEKLDPGVIFCLKNDDGNTKFDSTYALEPFYLVYVSNSGEMKLNFTHTKKILDLLKKKCIEKHEPDKDAVTQFNKITSNCSDMSKYQNLLAKAVYAITGKEEEKGIESLFQRGETVLSQNSFQGINDFEVISYLIILENKT